MVQLSANPAATTVAVRELHGPSALLRRALEALPFVPMLKHVLADHYQEASWQTVRPPLTQLTPMLEERLQEILDTVGVLPNFAD